MNTGSPDSWSVSSTVNSVEASQRSIRILPLTPSWSSQLAVCLVVSMSHSGGVESPFVSLFRQGFSRRGLRQTASACSQESFVVRDMWAGYSC